jgi:hypothetical protein
MLKYSNSGCTKTPDDYLGNLIVLGPTLLPHP